MGKTNKNLGRSSLILFSFALIIALAMAYQAFILLNPKLFQFMINKEFKIPIETFSQLWIGVSSVYIGVDRGIFCYKTTQLKYGEADVGNPLRLRKVILVSALLMFESMILGSITSFDYSSEEFTTAFGVSCILYIAGTKAIKGGTFRNGSQEKEETKV